MSPVTNVELGMICNLHSAWITSAANLIIENAFGKALRPLLAESELVGARFSFDAELCQIKVSTPATGEQAPSLTTSFKITDALGISCSELIALVEVEMKKKRSAARS